MNGEFLKRISKIGFIFFMILLISYLFIPAFDQKKVTVRIPRGTDSKNISRILRENKVIPSWWLFFMLVKILGWENDLKAGFYEFESPTLLSVLCKIKRGQVKLFRITIPEGLPKWEVANLLEKKQIVDARSFLEVVNNAQIFYSEFPWLSSVNSLEGYLFPETYYFCMEEDPRKIAGEFLLKFEEKVLPIYRKEVKKNDFSLHQIIILASIIEKEARVDSEKPIIAGVFYNRLKNGMKLMADPTIKYALGDFHQKLTREMLRYPSIYNTYLYPGLPPGPICSPGIESIKAAIHPAQVNYLYFVARGDGTHYFSQTYKQHLKAINMFQKVKG